MSNRNDPMAEAVIEIPLTDLYSFKNHPFKVQDDERMLETAESIRNYGVLVPGIVRPRPEGGYEIISGHRRKRASELAGKETMPVIVRNLDDDEAAIIMVDSNLQRDNILPSERSKAWPGFFSPLPCLTCPAPEYPETGCPRRTCIPSASEWNVRSA